MRNSLDYFDLIIVGAGIVGACCAYFSKRNNPQLKVLVIDKDLMASGATRYSIGLDIPYGHTAEKKQLSFHSRIAWQALFKEINSLPFFQVPLYGVASENSVETIKNNFLESPLLTDEPDLNFLNLGAQQTIFGSYAASYALTQLTTEQILLHSLSQLNIKVWSGLSVTHVEQDLHRVRIHLSNLKEISAGKVILATGPWTLSTPFSQLTAGHGLKTKKIVAFHFNVAPKPQAKIYYFFDEDAFLLPFFPHQHWVLSITVQDWDVLPDNNVLQITDNNYQQAMSILQRYCPDLMDFCSGGRVFCDTYRPNFTPLISPVSDSCNNIIICSGSSGSGFRLAPGMAKKALSFCDLTH